MSPIIPHGSAGHYVNTIDMTISIAPDSVAEIQQEIEAWHDKVTMLHKQLESLIGNLQFMSQVIRAGQVFPKWVISQSFRTLDGGMP